MFQLTRPRGARRHMDAGPTAEGQFQLTRPRGARLLCVLEDYTDAAFQLTRPRGARPSQMPLMSLDSGFNSRAREGRDTE